MTQIHFQSYFNSCFSHTNWTRNLTTVSKSDKETDITKRTAYAASTPAALVMLNEHRKYLTAWRKLCLSFTIHHVMCDCDIGLHPCDRVLRFRRGLIFQNTIAYVHHNKRNLRHKLGSWINQL